MPKDATVSDAMVKDVFTLKRDQDVIDAIKLMVARNITGAPVIDDEGKLLGILSDTDGIDAVMKMGYDPNYFRTVEEFMTLAPECVSPSDSLFSVAELFMQRRFRRFPVVDNGQLVGQVSRLCVLRELTRVTRL